MTNTRQALGRWGEAQAAEYLNQRGYIILERNVRTTYGEIDLVARQGTVLVFVEVKTRASTAFGLPETSVTPRKQAHMLAAAEAYLQSHPDLQGDWRVDVIAIQRLRSGRNPEIAHFENALR
jgi:putative endonuclease